MAAEGEAWYLVSLSNRDMGVVPNLGAVVGDTKEVGLLEVRNLRTDGLVVAQGVPHTMMMMKPYCGLVVALEVPCILALM
jgi:hypothetical protein